MFDPSRLMISAPSTIRFNNDSATTLSAIVRVAGDQERIKELPAIAGGNPLIVVV
ncbi:hypothetical protein CFAEC_08800 [Corynebacterium faecale]|uniref:hypothetical protein n=1 Tax=Corynebacterium faecale TaxID=1758466 RepID=UPI0025B57E01|nr:hypothetical protein [Corynebacterium faecale]WJY92577.1 hypothetical protein CFAEC_08800 [Corynebacterium faecale]